MPDLPLLSQTDVTLQNQTTGQVDYLKFEGNSLTGSALFNYGLSPDFKIVANQAGGLVTQSQTTGFVDFLKLNATDQLVSTALSNVSVPRIFGLAGDAGAFGSQLADGSLDFLQFNSATGQLTSSALASGTAGLPKAVSAFAWDNSPGPPSWFGLGAGLNGDNVQLQAADGSLDMIGFSGNFGAGTLAFNSSFAVPGSAGTPTVGETNPDSFYNLQDGSGTPQGLENVSMTASGQLDLTYWDTGLGDPTNEGIMYASNLLNGSFAGWNVVQGGLSARNLFPVS
jgi:hypothetical protein